MVDLVVFVDKAVAFGDFAPLGWVEVVTPQMLQDRSLKIFNFRHLTN